MIKLTLKSHPDDDGLVYVWIHPAHIAMLSGMTTGGCFIRMPGDQECIVEESPEQVAAMVNKAMGVDEEDPVSEAVRTSWPFTVNEPGTYRFARSEGRLILEKL